MHAMREPSSSTSPREVTADVWRVWILEAIRKIRLQKQRPSIQRICQAIAVQCQHTFHEDIVAGKLEEAVASGAVVKVYNQGLHSYKVPAPRRRVAVSARTDLSRLVAKAVRDLGECDGSNLKSIETYVQKSNNIELAAGADFPQIVKDSVKSAVQCGYLVQDGKLFKVGKVPNTIAKKRRSDSPKKRGADDDSVSTHFFFFFMYLLFSYLN